MSLHDLLEDAAGRATAERVLDARAIADGALRRAAAPPAEVGRLRRRSVVSAAVVSAALAAAAAALAFGVVVVPPPTPLLAGAGESGSGSWRPLLLALLPVLVGTIAGLCAVLVLRRRLGGLGALAAAAAVLAVAAATVPPAVDAAVVGWTRAGAGQVPGPVMVAEPAALQRPVPPPAFAGAGQPRTTRVSLVVRGSVGGWEGLYGVDADSGGMVRLDDLVPGRTVGDLDELAVSPNGRFVVWETPGDDRHTGATSGAAWIDLERAVGASRPTLQPPGVSTAGRFASTSLAVLDDGTLVVVRDGNRSLWVYPPSGGREELPAFGAVDAIAPLPGNRFVVVRADRLDVVDATTRTSLGFAARPAALPAGPGAGPLAAAWSTAGLLVVPGDGPGQLLPVTAAPSVDVGALDLPEDVVVLSPETDPIGPGVLVNRFAANGTQVAAKDTGYYVRTPAGVVVPASGAEPTRVERVEPEWTILVRLVPLIWIAVGLCGLLAMIGLVRGRPRRATV